MITSWNIGIDVGGTNSNIGLVSRSGRILDKTTIPTKGAEEAERFVATLYQEATCLLERNNLSFDDVDTIGMGVPGTVDPVTGFVLFCPNIPWTNLALGTLAEEKFKKKVHIDQDVRLAALAEKLLGAGTSFTDILCVTVGTGIGAGIIIDGEIYRGALNTAGEMGHMIIVKDGRQCTCGQRGCLERYASGSGIIECALESMDASDFGSHPQTTESVFRLAKEGNPKALSVVNSSVEYLALGIVNAVNLLSPQLVIVGGGVAENGELFFELLRKYVYRYGFYSWTDQDKLEIRKTELGADAAMIGAALLPHNK